MKLNLDYSVESMESIMNLIDDYKAQYDRGEIDNAFVDGLISLTIEDFEGITTCFEVGENLKYDSAKMQELIDTYGLYTYEEWADLMTEDIFDMFNCKYYKIYVGLGILTEEDFYTLLEGLYLNLSE